MVVLARPSPTTTPRLAIAIADVQRTRSGQLAGLCGLRPLALRQKFIGLAEPKLLQHAMPIASRLRTDARQPRGTNRHVMNFRRGAALHHFVERIFADAFEETKLLDRHRTLCAQSVV